MGTTRLRPRDRWLVLLAGLGFLAACVAAAAVRRSPHTSYLATPVRTPPPTSGPPPPTDVPEHSRASHLHLRIPHQIFDDLAVLLVAVLLVLGILLIVRLIPSLELRRNQPPDEEPVVYAPAIDLAQARRQVTATLDDALAGLRGGGPERAIIACWLRLEQIAEQAGHPRLSWQTSGELAQSWSGTLALSPEPLQRLAELYREARYSSHRMPADAVAAAQAALEQLRREIGSRPAAGRP